MDELRDLYQSTILDHNRKPRNFCEPESVNRRAYGYNPLCGDKLTIYLQVDDEDRVREIGFQGSGCAISTASASLMTETVKGRTSAEIDQIFTRFHELVAGSPGEATPATDLGKLAVFGGVREYPIRVKCATLAWHALRAALRNEEETAKTE
ncbi:MAG: SUF system NifU family Fe-S cluster assembly protein [Myxococcota bacterium]